MIDTLWEMNFKWAESSYISSDIISDIKRYCNGYKINTMLHFLDHNEYENISTSIFLKLQFFAVTILTSYLKLEIFRQIFTRYSRIFLRVVFSRFSFNWQQFSSCGDPEIILVSIAFTSRLGKCSNKARDTYRFIKTFFINKILFVNN